MVCLFPLLPEAGEASRLQVEEAAQQQQQLAASQLNGNVKTPSGEAEEAMVPQETEGKI